MGFPTPSYNAFIFFTWDSWVAMHRGKPCTIWHHLDDDHWTLIWSGAQKQSPAQTQMLGSAPLCCKGSLLQNLKLHGNTSKHHSFAVFRKISCRTVNYKQATEKVVVLCQIKKAVIFILQIKIYIIYGWKRETEAHSIYSSFIVSGTAKQTTVIRKLFQLCLWYYTVKLFQKLWIGKIQ